MNGNITAHLTCELSDRQMSSSTQNPVGLSFFFWRRLLHSSLSSPWLTSRECLSDVCLCGTSPPQALLTPCKLQAPACVPRARVERHPAILRHLVASVAVGCQEWVPCWLVYAHPLAPFCEFGQIQWQLSARCNVKPLQWKKIKNFFCTRENIFTTTFRTTQKAEIILQVVFVCVCVCVCVCVV